MADTPTIPTLASTAEVLANNGKIPARTVDAFSVRTVYASSIPGVKADCNLFTGLTAAGGAPTDNHTAINAVLATATANSPVHLILDGGFAMGKALKIPATGHVRISGHGWTTGIYMMAGANSHAITNTAGTDLSSHDVWNPGLGATAIVGSNVTLSNFRIHCNRGTYPSGNCNGTADGTNGAAASPDARGVQTNSWLLCGLFFNALDNLVIDKLWVYDPPTFHINLYACTRYFIDNCRLEAADSTFSGNTDGVHLNGGCVDGVISNCWGATGDDFVAANSDEGNGQAIDGLHIHHCHVRAPQSVLRCYGKSNGACKRIRMDHVSATGIRLWAITLGDDGGVGASLEEATHDLSVSDCDFAFATSGNLGPENAIMTVAGNAGSVVFDNVRFHEPAEAYPFVLMTPLTSTISRLVLNNCSIYRNSTGFQAAYLLEGAHGTIGDLVVNNLHVCEESGHTYTDIANLINLHGTAVGSVTLSGKFKGVATLVNVASSSTVGAIDLPDVTHQSNAGSATAHSVVAAGSTVPVSVGRYRGVNLAGIASGTASLTGPGLTSSGFGIADAMAAPGTIYRSSDQNGLTYKDGSSAINVFSFGAAAPATAYTLTGPASGQNNVASSNFTVTPNGSYTGTITVTPSGGGLSTPIVKTFSGSGSQAFTITPTATGTVTLTPTNGGSLTNPSALSYSVSAGAAHAVTLTHGSGGTSLAHANATAFQAGAGSFSVGCFVKFGTGLLTRGASQSLITKADDGTHVEYTLFWNSGANAGAGGFSWVTNAGSSTYEIDGAAGQTVGPWYFVVGVWDATAGKISLYTNNALDAGPTTATQPDNNTSSLVLGNSLWFGSATGLEGSIAMAFKYPFALTTGSGSQMEYLYNGGHGRSSAEILAHTGLTTPDFLYAFDNSGALGTDSGANSLNLTTVVGTPTQGTGPA